MTRKIICKVPSTFFSENSPIKIYDNKKKLFYFHPNNEKNISFNLPVGTYFTNNFLNPKPFKPYVNYKLPDFNYNPKDFKIIVKSNPHKATINTTEKTITVDPKISNSEFSPCQDFIIAHEVAHLHYGGNKFDRDGKIIYNAEQKCDELATNWMLAKGFNPSQIKAAVEMLKLSDPYRKACVHNNTINMNFRR